MFAAIELDLFTSLDAEPVSATTLANKLALDSDALEKLLTGLASLDYLECEDQLYQNTAFASRALVRGKQDYEGSTREKTGLRQRNRQAGRRTVSDQGSQRSPCPSCNLVNSEITSISSSEIG